MNIAVKAGIKALHDLSLYDYDTFAKPDGLSMAFELLSDIAYQDALKAGQAIAKQQCFRQVPQHRVEHAQHLSGLQAVQKFAQLGLTVVANPHHILTDKVRLACLGSEARRAL